MPGCTVVLILPITHQHERTAANGPQLRSGSHHRRVRHRRPHQSAATSWGGRAGPLWPLLPPTTRIGTTRREVTDIATCFGPGSCPHVGLWTAGRVRYALEQLCPGDMLLLCGKGRRATSWCRGKKIPYDERRRSAPAPVNCWTPAHSPVTGIRKASVTRKRDGAA